MAQYLIETGKVKVSNTTHHTEWLPFVNVTFDLRCRVLQMSRNQRFSASFYHSVETLVTMLVPHIAQKYKDNLDATRNANHSLAVFIKVSWGPPPWFITLTTNAHVFHVNCVFVQRCFTFMDRGFVFKQINNYINCFMPGDSKVILSYCTSTHFK